MTIIYIVNFFNTKKKKKNQHDQGDIKLKTKQHKKGKKFPVFMLCKMVLNDIFGTNMIFV
jgi:hypothetical protein